MKKEFFFGLNKLHIRYACEHTRPAERDLIARRRAAFAAGNLKEWNELAMISKKGPADPETPFFIKQSEIFRDALFKKMKVPAEVYQKTRQEIIQDDTLSTEFDAEIVPMMEGAKRQP